MAVCLKKYDINSGCVCGKGCDKCCYLIPYNKKQRELLNQFKFYCMAYKTIKNISVKYLKCRGENCPLFVKEESDWEGTIPAYCSIGEEIDCPFISNFNRRNTLLNLKAKITDIKERLAVKGLTVKTKWLEDDDTYCCDCIYRNKNNEICNNCEYRNQFKKGETK